MRRTFVAAAALCALTACQQRSRSLYAWGNYEDSVWSLTHAEGAADVDAQISQLTETVERARQETQAVPPGMHAHLGLLYTMRGDPGSAQAAFETERELYPESARFIDGLIQRMGGSE